MSSADGELLAQAVASDTDALSDLLGSIGPQAQARVGGKIVKHNQAFIRPRRRDAGDLFGGVLGFHPVRAWSGRGFDRPVAGADR